MNVLFMANDLDEGALKQARHALIRAGFDLIDISSVDEAHKMLLVETDVTKFNPNIELQILPTEIDGQKAFMVTDQYGGNYTSNATKIEFEKTQSSLVSGVIHFFFSDDENRLPFGAYSVDAAQYPKKKI